MGVCWCEALVQSVGAKCADRLIGCVVSRKSIVDRESPSIRSQRRGSRPRKSELSKSHGGCPRVPRAQTRRGVRAYLAKSFPKLSSVPR